MAKLPTVTDLSPTGYSGVTSVVTEDTSQVGAGERYLADAIRNGPSPMPTLRKMAEQVTSQQTGAATVATDNELTDIVESFKDRRDYENFEEDFAKKSKEITDRYAGSITDPQARAEYSDQLQAKLENARRKIDNHGDDLWRSSERVKLADLLKKSADSIGRSDFSDLDEKNAGIERLVQDALEIGHLDNEEEADKLIKQYQQEGFITGFKSLNHDAQSDFLVNDSDTNPFNNLSTADQHRLRTQWREDDVDYQAQDHVDQALLSDVSEEDALKSAFNIEDVQIRDETIRRTEMAYADKRRVETQSSATVHDSWLLAVTDGEATISQLRQENKDEWNAMSDSDKVRLLELERKTATSTPMRTNPHFYNKMMELQADNRYEEMGKLFSTHGADNLAISDYKSFSKLIANGPGAADDGLTLLKRVTSKLAVANIQDKKKEGMMIDEAGRYIRQYHDLNGRQPTDQEMNDYIDVQLMEFNKERTLLGIDYLMPDATVTGVELTGDDETRLNDAIMYLQMRKAPITKENIDKVIGVLNSE
jgi:hypothetical protein